MHSEVAAALGTVKFNLDSLWTSPRIVLVTGGLLRALLMVCQWADHEMEYFVKQRIYIAVLAIIPAPKHGGLSPQIFV